MVMSLGVEKTTDHSLIIICSFTLLDTSLCAGYQLYQIEACLCGVQAMQNGAMYTCLHSNFICILCSAYL